jgi:hypothetical protein
MYQMRYTIELVLQQTPCATQRYTRFYTMPVSGWMLTSIHTPQEFSSPTRSAAHSSNQKVRSALCLLTRSRSTASARSYSRVHLAHNSRRLVGLSLLITRWLRPTLPGSAVYMVSRSVRIGRRTRSADVCGCRVGDTWSLYIDSLERLPYP